MSALAISGLKKRYGPVTALAGVDLEVRSGSRTAIVGPSATAIDSAQEGSSRFALSEPSIGSITTRIAPPP